MVFEIITLIVVTSLICLGVYTASQFENCDTFDDYPELHRDLPIKGKMILWWVRYYGSYLPEFWRKPFYLCLPCMASIYSIPVIAFSDLTLIQSLMLYPFLALSVCGLNTIISYKVL